jgi:hypothetical protein
MLQSLSLVQYSQFARFSASSLFTHACQSGLRLIMQCYLSDPRDRRLSATSFIPQIALELPGRSTTLSS